MEEQHRRMKQAIEENDTTLMISLIQQNNSVKNSYIVTNKIQIQILIFTNNYLIDSIFDLAFAFFKHN